MTEQDIQIILKEQHDFFATGKTIPVEFRMEQLAKLKHSLISHEEDLNTALKKDLGKSQMESYMCEVGLTG